MEFHDNVLMSNIFRNSLINQGTNLMKCTNCIVKKYEIDYIQVFDNNKIVLKDKLLAESDKLARLENFYILKMSDIFCSKYAKGKNI